MSGLPQTNGLPVSALLTDPKALKAHLSNGTTSLSSHPHDPSREPRQSSEPLSASFPSTSFDFDFDFPAPSSKDDAHAVTQGQHRGSPRNVNTTMAQAQSSFNPRHLLDPKGLGPNQSQKDTQIKMLNSGPSVSGFANGVPKRDAEELEGQGMGNMIERIHGVAHRDARPQKKQKIVRPDDDYEKKPEFTAGGKGGDIGEYLREKRKEGQSNTVPSGDVVNLTAGTKKRSCLLYSSC